MDSCAEIKSASIQCRDLIWQSLEEGAGNSRFWRKVPESDTRFGGRCRKTILMVLEEGAGKRYARFWRKVPESDTRGFGGRCRKAMLGVWRKVPESDARSVVMQKSVNGYQTSDGEQRVNAGGAGWGVRGGGGSKSG